MSPKKHSQRRDAAAARQSPPRREAASAEPSFTQVRQDAVVRRAAVAPDSLRPRDVLQLQRAVGNKAVGQLLSQAARPQPPQKKESETGLPDDLKAGVENLSGVSLDDQLLTFCSLATSAIELGSRPAAVMRARMLLIFAR